MGKIRGYLNNDKSNKGMNYITWKFTMSSFSPYKYFLLRSSFLPPKNLKSPSIVSTTVNWVIVIVGVQGHFVSSLYNYISTRLSRARFCTTSGTMIWYFSTRYPHRSEIFNGTPDKYPPLPPRIQELMAKNREVVLVYQCVAILEKFCYGTWYNQRWRPPLSLPCHKILQRCQGTGCFWWFIQWWPVWLTVLLYLSIYIYIYVSSKYFPALVTHILVNFW